MMMCSATASPAAASSGPGGDGFFPAATISSSPAPGALFMPVPEGSVAAAGLGLGLPAADSRGHYQLLLSGRALADRYRRIYTAALSDRDQGGSGAGHPASSYDIKWTREGLMTSQDRPPGPAEMLAKDEGNLE
uniref:E3 ubiquitin-protein ligase MYCBP2-like isoform X1 n=1 Tax=Halichoerus grypus TaxID=9711 RepID=UPI001658E839|nr:E3 ubiquitin-protein ligase MYCBP2-like isoform X1 [Halichoerus grypus]